MRGPDWRQWTTTLEMDTFFFHSNIWTEASLESPSTFASLICNHNAIVIEEVVYWTANCNTVLAHDRALESLQLIKLPSTFPGGLGDVLGSSEGNLQYICYMRH